MTTPLDADSRAAVAELKARYCRYLDTHRFAALVDLFTPDGSFAFGPGARSLVRGRDALFDLFEDQFGAANSTHQIWAPELRREADASVHAIWAMRDRVERRAFRLDGAGYYEDRYVETEAGWRIASSRIHRVRVDLKPRTLAVRAALLVHRAGLLKGTKLDAALAEGVGLDQLP